MRVTGTPRDHGTSQGLGMSPEQQESIAANYRRSMIDEWERSGYRECARCHVWVHPRGVWSCQDRDCPEQEAQS